MSQTPPATLNVEEQNRLRVAGLAKTGYTFQEILDMTPEIEQTSTAQYFKDYLVSTRPEEPKIPKTQEDAQQRLMRLRDTLDPMIAAGNVAAIRTALQLEVEIARLAGLYDQKPPPDEHINYQIEGVSEDDLR